MSRRAVSGPASILALFALASLAFATSLPAGCAREVPCKFNSDCALGYCLDGSCQQDCVDAERDCPGGFVCNANAQCVPPTSTSTGSGTGGTGTASTSSSTDTGGTGTTTTTSATGGTGGTTSTTTTTTTSSTTSTTSTPTTKRELDICSVDADCAAPLVCRNKVAGNPKRCTRLCSATSQCMTGTRCELFGAEQYCGQNDIGRSCTTAANPCNFACLNDQYCTSECNDAHECPNGYGCMTIQGYRICVKAEAPCSTGNAGLCIAPDACDESPPLIVGGCTLLCDTPGDCPQRAAALPPWTCDGAGLCRRPADVFGPLPGGATPAQYANDCQGNVVTVCNDGFHMDFNAFSFPNPPSASCTDTMTTPGIATDSCLNSCRYQGGCSQGFACVGLGDLGSTRIGLCLPAGASDVGTSCTLNSHCLHGYCLNGTCSRDCTADGVCPNGTTCVGAGGPAVEGKPFKRCQ